MNKIFKYSVLKTVKWILKQKSSFGGAENNEYIYKKERQI